MMPMLPVVYSALPRPYQNIEILSGSGPIQRPPPALSERPHRGGY